MFLISAEVSGNIMEAARSPIGKEPVKRMKIPAVIKNKFENMKYRHKLTILLVTASLVPMILLVLYSHDRMSSLLREKEMNMMKRLPTFYLNAISLQRKKKTLTVSFPIT